MLSANGQAALRNGNYVIPTTSGESVMKHPFVIMAFVMSLLVLAGFGLGKWNIDLDATPNLPDTKLARPPEKTSTQPTQQQAAEPQPRKWQSFAMDTYMNDCIRRMYVTGRAYLSAEKESLCLTTWNMDYAMPRN